MSYFEFPHTREYDGDLGYIIKKLMELTDKYNTFFAYNSIKFADPIEWDITKQYPAYTIVFDSNNAVSLISKQPVPAGIDISNGDYWEIVGPLTVDGDARLAIENILRFVTNIYESGTTATAVRSIGDFLVVDKQLWKVTAAINIGETYTEGVNITKTTIENMAVELNPVDTALDTTSNNAVANSVVALKVLNIESSISTLNNLILSLANSVNSVVNRITAAENNITDISSDITDLKNDLDTTNTNLASESSTREAADDVLSARIDAIASLPSGSTSGDAELRDIRIGSNGKTYASAGAAVRGQFNDVNNDLNELTRTNEFTNAGWVQGTAYIQNPDTIKLEATNIRCRLLMPRYLYGLKAAVCDSGYVVNYMVCSVHNGDYYKAISQTNNYQRIDFGDYTNDYYLIFVCRKSDNSTITPAEAIAHVKFISKLDTLVSFDELSPYINYDEVAPDSIQLNKLYYRPDNEVLTSHDGYLKKYTIEADTTYKISSFANVGDSGFDFVSYFDSADNFISSEYTITPGINNTITMQTLHIPQNASWFYAQGRYGEPNVYYETLPKKTLPQVINELEGAKKKISILFVGNSLTQDGIAYLPYLLKNYYPNVDFKFYIYYNGGFTLAQQYQKFIANTACDEFSIAENTESWINTTITMSNLLSTYKFDIVCFQEYFNYKSTYTEADLADLNNCKDYITANYTGGNGLEFIELLHAPKRDNAASIFNLTVSGNELILKKTVVDDIIPMGIGIYNALNTPLDSLGDAGHLSTDGTHAQEGLPCLLETFVAACWLFDRLGMPRSIYGCPIRITTDIFNLINVPGPNLGSGVITGNDYENLLAQEVAIDAYKEGKSIVLNNLI